MPILFFDILVRYITGVLGDSKRQRSSNDRRNQLFASVLPCATLRERPCFIKSNHLEDTAV